MTDDLRSQAIDLYDRFTHEGMERRAFMGRMIALAGSVAAAEALIASIARLISSISELPASAATRVWLESSLACTAPSAFRLTMLDISSSDALVSSREAACSLAPSASD